MKRLYFLVITILITITLSAQTAEDTTDNLFHDALLNNFVGKWKLSGTVHEQEFKNIDLEAAWVLNHQFLQLHEKTRDTVPWLHMLYESLLFIGYDHTNKRYVARLMNVFGADDKFGDLLYGNRNGNEIKFTSQLPDPASGSFDVESFIWQPESKSWHWIARPVNKGKEEAPYLDLTAVAD